MIFIFICNFFNSITLQQVKRKYPSIRGKYQYPDEINNSASKIRKRKRSSVTTPATETLNDENWGVRIKIFLIFMMIFSIFLFLGVLDGFSDNWYTRSNI